MRKTALIFFLLFSAGNAEDLKLSPQPAYVPRPAAKGSPAMSTPSLGGSPALPLFQLSDFSGGLNLISPPSQIGENQALVCQNWIFSRDGSLVTRPGFAAVNSAVLSKQYPIYGLYHYALPTSRGLLVGDSNYIWKMTDAGGFNTLDTFLRYDTLVGRVNAASKNIDSIKWGGMTAANTVANYVLETRYMRGDEVYFIGGANTDQKRNVDVISYDTAAGLYRVILRTNVTSTQSAQKFIINARSDSISKIFRAVQRNNTILGSQSGRRAFAYTTKLQEFPGIVNRGTSSYLPAAGVDTSSNGNIAIATATNALAGYIYEGFSNAGGTGIRHTRIIKRSNLDSLFWGVVDTAVVGQGVPRAAVQNYLVWSPVFTVVDSGVIDSVVNDSNSRLKIIDRGKNFSDKYRYGNAILEFLTGKLAGIQKITMALRNNGDTLFVFQQSSGYLPEAGDRYAVYNPGLEARVLCLYYDRVVFVPPIFINTIRYSSASSINDYPASNFLALPEQGGDTIVALVPFNGNLAVMQKYRLWTLLGAPGWTGDDIVLASDGIGCIAPNSIVVDGNFLYFVGLRGNIPTVFRWDGGGVKFTTAGGSNVFEGEGHLLPLTTKIDPLMMKVDRTYLPKASAGLFGEHLVVSLPFRGSTNNDSTIAINLRTGAISLWTMAAGMWHNGRAAGDSGQAYFTSPRDSGWVYLFGGATDSLDLGQTFNAVYQSGWQDFGSPTVQKQGVRLWSQYFRSNGSGTGTWKIRSDFGTSDLHTFAISTNTGEQDENNYIGVGALGKRFGFRFEGSGLRASFRLNALRCQYIGRGDR